MPFTPYKTSGFKPYNPIPQMNTGIPTEEPVEIKQGFLSRLTSPGLFKSSPTDSPLKASLKTAGNVIPSAISFGKGLIDFLNPMNTIETAKQIGESISGAKDEGVKPLDVIKEMPKAAYETLVPTFFRQLFAGDTEGAQKTITEDPTGQLAPVLLVGKQVAEKAGYGPQFDAVMKNTSSVVTKPAAAASAKVRNVASTFTRFGTSQATGLSPSTITTILENPKQFTTENAPKYTRQAVGQEVHGALTKRIQDLRSTGTQYDGIRTTPGTVIFPKNIANEVLTKYGLKVNRAGNIIRTVESVPLKSGDIVALQNFYKIYGKNKMVSNNGFLNIRGALDQLSEWDATKSDVSNRIARDLRIAYDRYGKQQIPGLAELDAKYGPETAFLRKIKKEYLNPDGTFKDNAISKIANLTNKGKEAQLARLEKVVPGIGKTATILKAVEDINNAAGHKVGTYARSTLSTGGLVGGLMTGNLLLVSASILEAILSEPHNATAILRGYARLRGLKDTISAPIISTLKNINEFNVPALIEKSKKLNVGMTTEDVSGFVESLRKSKGLTAEDIMKTYPDIKLKRDVPATDVYGNKVTIPDGEVLTPYELKGNKVMLQDGETYIVSKNQFQNIKGNAVSSEAKEFAPELKGTEETVKGYKITEEEIKALRNDEVGQGMSRQDAIEYLKNEEYNIDNAPKYESYQLPNGKNYKEILIKAPVDKITTLDWKPLPNGDLRATQNGRTFGINKEGNRWYIFEENGQLGRVNTGTLEQAKKTVIDEVNSLEPGNNFKSSHWDEPNVISHLRLNERTYKGKKVTFMEELQSDWAREGRSKGFADRNRIKEIDSRIDEIATKIKKGGNSDNEMISLMEESKRLREERDGMNILTGVPNNPLLKNWQELSVKRALKEAVDNNSEYFAWINGEQTSARYNLATYLDNVKWKKDFGDKVVSIKAKSGTGSDFDVIVDKIGLIKKGGKEGWQGKKLDEVLGKGLADEIMKKENGTLSGEGLKFGGEWANNLYDKQVGNIVKDLTGAKIEKLDLGLPIEAKVGGNWVIWDNGYISGDLSKSNIKVGKEIFRGENSRDTYIITDILGDGKFKAVPKDRFDRIREQVKKEVLAGDRSNFEMTTEETFDISTKKTTQQGIKLTPEIKAKIKGEAPKLK